MTNFLTYATIATVKMKRMKFSSKLLQSLVLKNTLSLLIGSDLVLQLHLRPSRKSKLPFLLTASIALSVNVSPVKLARLLKRKLKNLR